IKVTNTYVLNHTSCQLGGQFLYGRSFGRGKTIGYRMHRIAQVLQFYDQFRNSAYEVGACTYNTGYITSRYSRCQGLYLRFQVGRLAGSIGDLSTNTAIPCNGRGQRNAQANKYIRPQ